MRQLFYYKIRQNVITKCVRFFITKCDSFITKCKITKCNNYYKTRRLLQIATVHNVPCEDLLVNAIRKYEMHHSILKLKSVFTSITQPAITCAKFGVVLVSL